MSHPYAARFAALYDLFYADKPYDVEAQWMSARLPPHARILDLACGTGGHALALAARGHSVTGLDLSLPMVQRARLKARARGTSAGFATADMRRLSVAEASFDAAVCLFDSIGYARTDDGVNATLTEIRRALRPGGRLVVEFWHQPAMVAGFDAVRVRRWPVDGGRVMRISETELIVEQKLARVTYSVFELRDDATYSSFEETHVNRYFTVPEMEMFLTQAGFIAKGWHDGFSDRSATDETWHVVGLAAAS